MLGFVAPPLLSREELLRLCWRRRHDSSRPTANGRPKELDEKGKFHPTSIALKDLCLRGFSVQRLRFFKFQDAATAVEARVNGTQGEILSAGFIKANVASVAALVAKDGLPAFRLIVDGNMPDRHDGHVSLMFAGNYDKVHQKELREMLADAFSAASPVAMLPD